VYIWQNHRMPYAQAGQWGYLRVLPTGDTRLLPLAGSVGARTAEAEPGRTGATPVAATIAPR
jgi:hypothetical protein